MGNIKCYHQTIFTVFFFQTKIIKQTKQNKTVVKIQETLIYLLRGETANHVNRMQHMLVSHSSCYFSSLEVNIAEVSNILTTRNKFKLVFMQY